MGRGAETGGRDPRRRGRNIELGRRKTQRWGDREPEKFGNRQRQGKEERRDQSWRDKDAELGGAGTLEQKGRDVPQIFRFPDRVIDTHRQDPECCPPVQR